MLPTLLFKRKPINKLTINKIIESWIADFSETWPDAIILYLLIGCFSSLFLSIQSLIKYIEDETKQNAIKALKELIQICDSKENTKSGAKKTIKFFCHWFGLNAKNKFFKLILLILHLILYYKLYDTLEYNHFFFETLNNFSRHIK